MTSRKSHTKSMSWFRLYNEAIDDEKLRLLAFEDRWHFVALLCCKSKGLIDGTDLPELRSRKIALKLGLSTRELEEVARRLAEVGLIDRETLQPLAWDERQFQSDSSTERVREYRERQKQAGNDMKRSSNVSVTVQETDTDTEKEAKASLPASQASECLQDGSEGQLKRGLESATSVPSCPVDRLIDAYETSLPTLPAVRRSLFMAGKNVEAMRQRWKWVMSSRYERGERAGQRLATTIDEGIDWFSRYFAYVSESKFLTGGNGKWSANLAWLMTASKFEAVLSGQYHREAA